MMRKVTVAVVYDDSRDELSEVADLIREAAAVVGSFPEGRKINVSFSPGGNAPGVLVEDDAVDTPF